MCEVLVCALGSVKGCQNATLFLEGFGILQCWKGGLNPQCPCTNMVLFRMEMKQYDKSENMELWQAKFWFDLSVGPSFKERIKRQCVPS